MIGESLPQVTNESAELAQLEQRVNALLPPRYQGCLDAVSPTSMGSAELKFGPDARVAWDQIWTHFCDLALAGGPPHRGTLLEAPTVEEAEASPAECHLVGEEIARGIRMTTGLPAERGQGVDLGWVSVDCQGEGMAGWLLRAVMAENVFCRYQCEELFLPAGPTFRLAKEVKNVVVALAKTCHYWATHLSANEQLAAANLFTGPQTLLEPSARPQVLRHAAEYHELAKQLEHKIEEAGLSVGHSNSHGWVGVQLSDEWTAAWFVRSAIAENILARREAEILLLPVPHPPVDETSLEVLKRLGYINRLYQVARRSD